ncbi:MAG: AAA family ATPase [Candidatus Marinarcus sp.]|uniref:AAA family ATPase n=1 Tax=Candidatus Marinarcus sp. TaxID=3100987 RepID=UPI003B005676
MELSEVANQLVSLEESIVLVYAFNATGKTRLSVTYKNETKKANDDKHSGVYYNAFSEDLFGWDNDNENNEENICLKVLHSSLSKFHSLFTEEEIREKLKPYNPKYDFRFEINDAEKGIESITFFMPEDEETNIKISRGEERIFVWCFFLALFEVEGWADEQSKHFFIDDPVSSLDDHNIFVTAITLFDLIEKYFKERKIVITTHHIGLFSILYNWLYKGEKASKFKKRGGGSYVKSYILNRKDDNTLSLDKFEKSVFLYHLHLLQKLKKAKDDDELYGYHFVLLRQILENIASFLGVGQFAYVLQQIGINDVKIPNMINVLSHKNVFYYETDTISPSNKDDFKEILNALFAKYNFQV